MAPFTARVVNIERDAESQFCASAFLRDFLDVRDVVSAYVEALASELDN